MCYTISMIKEKHGYCIGGWSPTYRTWKSMRARCKNPSSPNYSLYGGRGIVVCPQWDKSFSAFLRDMGERPAGFTLDRIDNDGNYEPKNCRWASQSEQQRNKNNNRNITYLGKTQCVTDWANELGIDPRRLFQRFARGWSVDQALQTRLGGRRRTVSYAGKTQCIVEWARELGVSRNTIARRLRKGQSIDQRSG